MFAGFVEANSSNLPHIDYDMVDTYYRWLSIAGVQDVKAKRYVNTMGYLLKLKIHNIIVDLADSHMAMMQLVLCN